MVSVGMRRTFSKAERYQLRDAERRAADLVSRFYVVAPREWRRMPYEVRTVEELEPEEIDDGSFAQVRCYAVRRTVGGRIVDEHELYRICVHDHEILRHASDADGVEMPALLLYVLTHELVHVVRFGQRMQRLDLPTALRPVEEASVDRTARRILRATGDRGVTRALERLPAPDA